MSASSAAVEEAGGFLGFTSRQWLILLMIQFGNTLFGMTITLANLVLPQMRGTLSATQDEIAWVITFNLVATAVATPMTGWLASRLGWRNLMFFTILGFTISALLCGLANSLEMLILARVAQGLFGAPIMPMGQAILIATFPPHKQPVAMVIWGIGAVMGPVIGPIVGSMATEAYNWRAAFFTIIPPGMVALAVTWFALSEHTTRKVVRFDWIGFGALSLAILSAQLIFDRGHKLDWFDSTEILIWAAVGVLALWVFIAHCLTAEQPFLRLTMLLDRNFAVGTLLAFAMGMLSFAGLVLMPTLLHDLRGYPDAEIGTLIAARGTGNWMAFLFTAQLTRAAPRFAIALGLGIQALAGFWMSTLDINLTEFDVVCTNFLQGLGQSVSFTPITLMAFATLPKSQVTEGSGLFTLMRNFGSSLFISMCVLVLVRTTTANYARMTEHITPYRDAGPLPRLPDLWDPATTSGLMRLANEVQRQAAMIGYVNAFTLMACTAAAAAPLAFLLRKPVRTA